MSKSAAMKAVIGERSKQKKKREKEEKATKAKKAAVASAKASVKPAVPAADRSKKKPSGAALFASLAGGRTPTKAAGKKRPKLEITPEVEEMVEAFTMVKTLAELVATRESEEKTELRAKLDRAYRDLMWEKQAQPENPKIIVRNEAGQTDCSMLYVTVAKFSPQFGAPDEGEDALEAAINFLCDEDRNSEGYFGDEQARVFVETELSFTPRFSLNLTDWFTQKEDAALAGAAEKLVSFLMGGGDELEAADFTILQGAIQENVKFTPVFLYSKELLGRLCGYCESKAQFDYLWDCIKPQVQLRQAKFGESDSAEERGQRLDHLAGEIIGEGLGVDLLADDDED